MHKLPTLWLVGLPRRKSSLSMLGRSSWMRLMVCSISIAHAVGSACAHAAAHRLARRQAQDRPHALAARQQRVPAHIRGCDFRV